MAHRAPIATRFQALLGFNVDHPVSGQKLRQQGRQTVQPALLVGRIEKQHVETRTCRTQRRREFYRIRANNLQTLAGTEHSGVGGKRCQHFRRRVDHHHPLRAARRRFKAERAAAGKEVEARPPREILPEPVEQRFANAVRRRAQTLRVGERQGSPPPLPTDDAYCVQNQSIEIKLQRSIGTSITPRANPPPTPQDSIPRPSTTNRVILPAWRMGRVGFC